MFPTADAKKRFTNQCEEIVERLKRGPMLNTELFGYGNHTARISQLRQQGYEIICTRVPKSRGLTEYRLVEAAA